jgi:hypothetical protein
VVVVVLVLAGRLDVVRVLVEATVVVTDEIVVESGRAGATRREVVVLGALVDEALRILDVTGVTVVVAGFGRLVALSEGRCSGGVTTSGVASSSKVVVVTERKVVSGTMVSWAR